MRGYMNRPGHRILMARQQNRSSSLFVSAIVSLLLLPLLSFAQEDEFAEAKALVQQNTACDQLTADQLEKIGDYYMELMHPGEVHEIMDRRMGGEGSAMLRNVHISIAQRFYCNAYGAYGMMGGMMAWTGMMGQGMYGYGMTGFGWAYNILYLAILVLVVAWLYQKVRKEWK